MIPVPVTASHRSGTGVSPRAVARWVTRLQRATAAELVVRAVGGTAAVAGGIGGAVVFAAGWWGTSRWQGPALAVAAAAIAVAWGLGLLGAWRALKRPEWAVLRSRLPEGLRSRVLSAVEFLPALERAQDDDVTAALQRAHVASTAAVLADGPCARLVPWHRCVAWALGALGVWGVVAAGYWAMPQVFATGWRSLWDVSAPVRWRTEERAVPLLSNVTISVVPPAYLGGRERVWRNASGGVQAPAGALVRVQGVPLFAAQKGALVFESGKVVALHRQKDGTWAARFSLERSDVFRVELVSRGVRRRGVARLVDVREDAPPFVRLLAPSDGAAITGDRLEVEFEAVDDHGIDAVFFVFRPPGGESVRRAVLQVGGVDRQVRRRLSWPVSGLRNVDARKVEFFVAVRDNDAVSGPKEARSQVVTLALSTPEGRLQELAERQRALLDALLDVLAARLTTPIPTSWSKVEDAQARFYTLRDKTRDVLRRLASLLALCDALQVDATVRDTYAAVRDDLLRQLRYEARLYERPVKPVDARKDADRVFVRVLERAIVLVDTLVIDQQLGRARGRAQAVSAIQERLEGALDRYRRSPTERERNALRSLVGQMEHAVEALLHQLAAVRSDARVAEHSWSDARELADLLSRVQEAVARGGPEEVAKSIAALRAAVDKLLQVVTSEHVAFFADRFGKNEEVLERVEAAIVAIEQQQLQVRRGTVSAHRTVQERTAAALAELAGPLTTSQSRRVGRLCRLLHDAGTGRGGSDLSARWWEVDHLCGELSDAVAHGDIEVAHDVVRMMVARLVHELDAAPESVRDKVRRALKGLHAVERAVQQVVSQAAPSLSPRDKRKLRGLAKEQRKVTRRIDAVANLVAQVRSAVAATQVYASLHRAKSESLRARSALRTHRIEAAVARQDAVLDILQQLRRSLKSGTQPTWGPLSVPDSGSQVVIPGPEEYQVPPEFREDIQRAMQQRAPRRWKEAILRYYEFLVH